MFSAINDDDGPLAKNNKSKSIRKRKHDWEHQINAYDRQQLFTTRLRRLQPGILQFEGI